MAYEETDDAFIAASVTPISPRVAGHVAQVLVNDNEFVHKGQKLIQLDPSDLQNAFNVAQAALNAAQARQAAAATNVQLVRIAADTAIQSAQSAVKGAESGVVTAQAQIDVAKSKQLQAEAQTASAQADAAQAQAEVVAAQAEVTRADTEQQRFSKLGDNNVVSQQEILNANAAAQAASAQFEARKKHVKAAEAQIAQAQAARQTAVETVKQAQSLLIAAQAQLAQAKAQLAAASVVKEKVAVAQSELATADAEAARLKAQLDQASPNLSYGAVLAPVEGRVTNKSVEVGQYVDVGQSIMAIVPQRQWVIANFKETQLTHIRPGQPVEIGVDAYPDMTLKGHVDSIQRGSGAAFSLLPPQNATGNYVKVVQRVPVKILLDEAPSADHPIGPGMSVTPEVKVQ
jgi:membrane fusion protein (multidrug efflux system)